MLGRPRGGAGRPSHGAVPRHHRGNRTIEAEDLIHLQTALEVQSEISDILNKNIFEMKTPVHTSAKIMMTAHITFTANNASLPTEYPELLSSKREVHHDQQSSSEEHVEVNCSARNVVSDIQISHRISLKTEKVEDSENLIGNKRILKRNNEFTCGHLVSGTDSETERSDAAQEKILLRLGDQKFSENKAAPQYAGEIEALHKPLKNSEHLQKRVRYLQNENLHLMNKVKPLADTVQSLKEKISKYDVKIKDFTKEKRSMQTQLVKSPEGNEERVKEVKSLIRKCKELQNQKIVLEKKKNQHHSGNKDTKQALHDFQIRNKKLEGKMTAGTCEKERLNAMLESLKHKYSNSQETNKKLGQLTEEKSSLEQELEGKKSEIKQMKEKETATKSELETHLQLMQTFAEKKLNLEMTLQACSNTKQMLLKDIEEVQSDEVYTEKKFMTEPRNAKADIDLLKYNLTTANTEYKRLSTVITDITEENQLLKRELNEYRQYASKYENDIRKLSKECLLLENQLWTIENERDVAQLEFHRLHKDYVYLRGQATALAWAQKKPKSSSGTMQNNCYSEHSTRTCKEIPLDCLSQGNEKITKIRKKIQQEELKRWKEKQGKENKNFRAVFISCTTSEQQLEGSTVQSNLSRRAKSAEFISEQHNILS
ncbi:coiled-coil domain-containing protein 110 isoform X2 [Phasianus colchicus]|uniref:coiled-coil domain-containing protein 110 isoform X2 n=1 Tax=Phasianus colchicus TaxID=9054 RepID=UPI00129E3DD4|nr:coiled-coil domain-containing protein 110 isoform X2 [Phasianus colchicus]